jgi:hypothetical protein
MTNKYRGHIALPRPQRKFRLPHSNQETLPPSQPLRSLHNPLLPTHRPLAQLPATNIYNDRTGDMGPLAGALGHELSG